MTETSDDVLATIRAGQDRRQGVNMGPINRPPAKRGDSAWFRLAAIAVVNAIILIAAGVVGFVMPIGLFGGLLVLILMAAATLGIAMAPRRRLAAPSLDTVRAAPVAQLPQQTARWLNAQRPALPAPAVMLADRIGLKLDQLGPQLATLDPEAPAAREVRHLVGEQLPDFVKGYAAVPPSLRSQPRNGQTPDEQLVEGLKVIDRQLDEMTGQLAQGDLDNLSTRGRYLQIRYQGDESA